MRKGLSIEFSLSSLTMAPAPSVIVVIIQLGEHSSADFVRENSLLFREQCQKMTRFRDKVTSQEFTIMQWRQMLTQIVQKTVQLDLIPYI